MIKVRVHIDDVLEAMIADENPTPERKRLYEKFADDIVWCLYQVNIERINKVLTTRRS